MGRCSGVSRNRSLNHLTVTSAEREAGSRFGWSAWMWPPPGPESNRRPHPYHGTAGNRYADSPFRRSRATVGTKVCALFSRSNVLCCAKGRRAILEPPCFGQGWPWTMAASATRRRTGAWAAGQRAPDFSSCAGGTFKEPRSIPRPDGNDESAAPMWLPRALLPGLPVWRVLPAAVWVRRGDGQLASCREGRDA